MSLEVLAQSWLTLFLPILLAQANHMVKLGTRGAGEHHLVGGFEKPHAQRHEYIIQTQEVHEELQIIILSTSPGFSLYLGLNLLWNLSSCSLSVVTEKSPGLTLESAGRESSCAPPRPTESETKLQVVKVTDLSTQSAKWWADPVPLTRSHCQPRIDWGWGGGQVCGIG